MTRCCNRDPLSHGMFKIHMFFFQITVQKYTVQGQKNCSTILDMGLSFILWLKMPPYFSSRLRRAHEPSTIGGKSWQ